MKELDYNIEDKSVHTDMQIVKDAIEGSESDINVLKQAGVDSTDQIAREYLFTDGNELDYTSSIAASTTVTIPELPVNTVSILISIRIRKTAPSTSLEIKRKSSDTSRYYFTNYGSNVQRRLRGNYELPTYQNSFYVVIEEDDCDYFRIIGYKVKE